MNYKSHIYKIAVFLILFSIGFIIYNQQRIYKERFQVKSVKPNFPKKPKIENYKYILPQDIQETICNDSVFKDLNSKILTYENVVKNQTLTGGGQIGWLRGEFSWITYWPTNLAKNVPSIKQDINIIKTIAESYMKFSYNNYDHWSTGWNSLPKGMSLSDWKKGTYKHLEEIIVAVNNLKRKINCFGKNNKIDFELIIKNMKRMQGILLNKNVVNNDITIFKKSLTEIKQIFDKSDKDSLPLSFKNDFMTIFGSSDSTPLVLSQSHFKRKGSAKKLNNWILFLEQKYSPAEGKDYNIIKGSNGTAKVNQSVDVSFFEPLKIVSAGTYNAEQEQENLPNFDIKDKGGYNLFRAVVVKPDIPVVSKSYSIKDSCKKEKAGLPLEMGNTPLILKNFARDTSTGNNRYDSSKYFGYPKLYIIENISESGKNLNNKSKTYYLSYSGNTTRKTKNNPNVKPLYHIRAYNPVSGKFDYAYDVGTTDSKSNVSLKVGRIDGSVETSLFTIEPDVNNNTIALLSYGFRGYGNNSGKNHYFYHSFDQSGRETETLSPVNEDRAKIWNLKKIT